MSDYYPKPNPRILSALHTHKEGNGTPTENHCGRDNWRSRRARSSNRVHHYGTSDKENGRAKTRRRAPSGGPIPRVQAWLRTHIPPLTQVHRAIFKQQKTHMTLLLHPKDTKTQECDAHPKSKPRSSPSIAVSPSISRNCCSALEQACEHCARSQGAVAACKDTVRSARWQGPEKCGRTLWVCTTEKCG